MLALKCIRLHYHAKHYRHIRNLLYVMHPQVRYHVHSLIHFPTFKQGNSLNPGPGEPQSSTFLMISLL